MRSFREEVDFSGHEMIRAVHPTTIEVTKDAFLTSRGDCVIGVRASKAVADLSTELKSVITTDGSTLTLTLSVDGQKFKLKAEGDRRLTLSDRKDMVIRRSDYISERTLGIRATAAASNLPRRMVESLGTRNSKGKLLIEVEV